MLSLLVLQLMREQIELWCRFGVFEVVIPTSKKVKGRKANLTEAFFKFFFFFLIYSVEINSN